LDWVNLGCGSQVYSDHSHDFYGYDIETREVECKGPPKTYTEWAFAGRGEYDRGRGGSRPSNQELEQYVNDTKIYGKDRWWYTRPLLSRQLVSEDPLICERVWECRWGAPSFTHWDTPLVFDISRLGYPDTLNGLRDYRPFEGAPPDFRDMRPFDMNGSGLGYWEWIGPRTPLLVTSFEIPSGVLTGRDLFGTFTWGKTWNNGYEPLATLDLDNDGYLRGSELDHLWFWFDHNSDAICDPSEVEEASDLVSEISVSYDPLMAFPMIQQGARLLDGTFVASWDWWSRSYEYPLFARPDGSFVEPVVMVPDGVDASTCLYQWSSDTASEVPLSGYLRFFVFADRLFVFAISNERFRQSGFIRLSFAPVYLKDGVMYWSTARTTAQVAGGVITGLSEPPTGSYNWTARPYQSEDDALGAILAGLSDSQLSDILPQALEGVPIFVAPFFANSASEVISQPLIISHLPEISPSLD
jgi:hypothetical protein